MPNRPFSSLCMKWLSVLMYERNSSTIQIFAAICSTVDYKRYYQSMSLFAFVYWKRDEQETWLVIFFFFFCSLRLKQISSCCIFPLEDFKLRVITTVSLLYTTDWVRPSQPRTPTKVRWLERKNVRPYEATAKHGLKCPIHATFILLNKVSFSINNSAHSRLLMDGPAVLRSLTQS